MSGPIGYDQLRAATVRQIAQLMAAAAITAPKSGGQLFLAGKPNFMETVIADDPATRRQLAAWIRARGKERRERIWFRDADAAEAVDAILFVGLLPGWYPPNYDCGACGYATCAEFLHHTNTLRSQIRRPRIHRTSLQPARHRPRHRGRLRSQNRRPPLHRLPLPDPRRHRRPQTRPHPGRPRRRPLAIADPQSNRLRPPHARPRLRPSRPAAHRHPASRRARRGPPRRRQEPPGTPAAHPPHPALTGDC
jgi:hypothetical protein